MIWDKLLERLDTKAHIPVGLGVFAVGSVFQWFGHLSTEYIAFTSTVLGFLGAHAIWGQPPDPPKAEEK